MSYNLHGILFAYRSNPQLRELSQHRNTCSVPFGSRHRMVDFMLSNMVNAGVTDVGLIVHENYQSLLDHVGSGKDWDLSRKRGGLRILPPFGYGDKRREAGYRGRMDALAGAYSYLEHIHQDYVVMAGGDIAINIDLKDVLRQHIATGADVTAVVSKTHRGDPKCSDYFVVDEAGTITDVAIHPLHPTGYESMEIYILSRDLLLELVESCVAHNIYSFSEGVLQAMVHRLNLKAYEFDGYSARLQSVASYFAQNQELLDPAVRADLFNPERPIRTKDRSDSSAYYGPDSHAVNSLIADGCIIEGEVVDSIIFRNVKVEAGAKVEHCVLMNSTVVGEGAQLSYAITDKGVQVNPGRMLMGHETYPLAIEKNAVV